MKYQFLAAVAALSFISAVPASAAEMFSIRPGDSFTYRASSDYWFSTYFAQSTGVGGDSSTATDTPYRVDVVVVDPRTSVTAIRYGGSGVATAGAPVQVDGAYMPPNGATTPFDYYFTFSSLSDQTVSITGLEGRTLEFRGPSFPVSFNFVPNVPEPATWLMMIAGFGMIGAVARQKARPTLARA